jgi:phage shock protein B
MVEAYEAAIPLTAILALFVGLPWLFLHYMTKWKQASALTREDEDLLDELHDVARRLDERLNTIERIIAADRELPPRVAQIHPHQPRLGETPAQAQAKER